MDFPKSRSNLSDKMHLNGVISNKNCIFHQQMAEFKILQAFVCCLTGASAAHQRPNCGRPQPGFELGILGGGTDRLSRRIRDFVWDAGFELGLIRPQHSVLPYILHISSSLEFICTISSALTPDLSIHTKFELLKSCDTVPSSFNAFWMFWK